MHWEGLTLTSLFPRGHHDEMETENMNPEDIYNSIKQTTADIQNLSFHSKLESYDPVKKKREFTSQDSGIQDLRNDSPDAVDSRKGNYNPSQYSDEVSLGSFIMSSYVKKTCLRGLWNACTSVNVYRF